MLRGPRWASVSHVCILSRLELHRRFRCHVCPCRSPRGLTLLEQGWGRNSLSWHGTSRPLPGAAFLSLFPDSRAFPPELARVKPSNTGPPKDCLGFGIGHVSFLCSKSKALSRPLQEPDLAFHIQLFNTYLDRVHSARKANLCLFCPNA